MKRSVNQGHYKKPGNFDYNLIVIGAGSAGLTAAYIAAAVKARVALIEKHKMGGDCTYTGCVPSKALIRSARFLQQTRRAGTLGFKRAEVEFDFADIMERVQRIVKTIEPHDSPQRFTRLGVDCIAGEAQITSPYTVAVNGRSLNTRSIVIATGAKPLIPPIDGLDRVDFLTSETVWGLRELPERLVVLGGGPIGCELTQCFARFGSKVTQVEMAPRILSKEDPDIAARVEARFREEGIDLRVDHKAGEIRLQDGQKLLVCRHADQTVEIPFDKLLIALGRRPETGGLGLGALGIELADNQTIETGQFLQTRHPNIYVCGDVAGPYQFTHTASHQAWYAAVNALFGTYKKFKADYSVIPWCTFTEPEVAHVGLNVTEATNKNIAHEVTSYDIADLDRAIAEEEAHGVVKVLTVPGKDKILGATIVGEHAGDLIAEYVLAMRHGLGLNKLLGTIHIYPTLAEANKYAAGEWRRAHQPQRLLKWVERFHAWRR